MKKGIRVFVVLLLAVAVMASYSVPADVYAAGTKKKPKADAVEYYTNSEDENTGIKSITILPYTYYNINGDTKEPKTVELNNAAIQKIAAEQIFPRWGVIAEGIFRDQANQLVTIEGSGMMSSDKSPSNSFDRHFSQTRDGVSGHNYSWGLNDLAKELGTPDAKSKHNTAEQGEFAILQGSTNNDEVVYSGIYPINNLKDARTLMGKSLRACADDNDLTVDDFLGNSKDKSGNEYRLPDLDNDKTDGGYCNVVTCVNRAGGSADYDYVCFGLAVYDFDVTPIAASDLSYIHAAQEYAGKEDPIKAAAEAHAEGVAYSDDPHSTDTFATNKSSQESTTSVSLTTEESEEIGSTTEESFEWGMEQEIGADVGIGPGSDNFARLTLHFQQNFHELWNTMKGSSQTKSKREERTVNQELVLPGHTAANIKQTNNTSKAWQTYQQPVVLNYKVAVFAMSGDYYNGWGGMISASRYDKEWMSILFDGSDGCEPGGCNALASLQNRAIVNADSEGYDRTKGKYKSWCDKSDWSYNTKINWNNIASTLAGDNRSSHSIPNYKGQKSSLKDMASQLLFAETARKFTRDRKIMTSEVSSLMPLYNLASVDITSKNRNFEVRTGDRLYLDGIELGGFDKDNVEFYGFDSSLGSWALSDDDAADADINDSGNVIKVTTADEYMTLNTDKQTGSQWVEISGEQTTSDYTYHLVWKVDKSKRIMTKQSVDEDATHPDDIMTEAELEAVDTPSLGITKISDTAEVKSIEVSGSYEGPYDQKINLNKELDVTVKSTSDVLMSIPIYWEDNGVIPADVDWSGETTFSTPGTYKVRAYSKKGTQKITSNWIDIKAKEKPALKTIDFSAPSLDEDLLALTKKHNTRSYDLDSYLKFYDQFNEPWEGTKEEPLPTIRFTVDDEDGAAIENGVLTVSKAGTYTVTARAYDENGNLLSYDIPPLKFRVTADRWLDSIEFNEPAVGKNDLKLQSVDDQIAIGNLKGLLSYYDQNGNPLELTAGETPSVTFRLTGEPDGAEIRSGGGYTFFAYRPGVYTIQPVIDGYSVNPVTIEVTEARYLVIETKDPTKQPITEYGGSVTVDLDKYVNATTQFGGSWKDAIPAMSYTLDAGVTGATIGETTVEGETVENAFVSDTPGKYIVHVAPKKASAYTAAIDDIEITVIKQSRVQAVGMDFLELKPEQRTVPTQAQEPILIDPSECVAYYDQFGERIDAENLAGLKLPKISGYTINTESFNNKAAVELTEVEGKPMLAADTAGICEVTPILADEGYEAYSGYLFLIDEETSEFISEAMGELIQAYFNVCAYHAKDAEQVVSDGLDIIASASTKDIAESLLAQYKNDLKKYGHTAGEPVRENIDYQTGAYEEVVYCTNCGQELHRDIIPAETHQLEHVKAVSPSCAKEGNIEYWVCSKCGKIFRDEEGTEEITEADTVVEKIPHNLTPVAAKEATCDKAGNIAYWECSECGKYFSDETGNAEVAVEDVTIKRKPHTLTAVNAKAATCENTGTKAYWRCEACEKLFADEAGTEEIDAPIATPKKAHELVKENRVAPTCEKAGTKAHWICENCEKLFADADGTEEITAADLIIPKKAHTLTKVKGVAATCEKKGTEDYWTCEDCGVIFSDEEGTEEIDAPVAIPKKGHSLAHIEAKGASCEAAGNIEYWACSECEKFFSDAEGETEISAADIVIKKKAHALTAVKAKPATCEAAGTKAYWKCGSCEKLFADADGTEEIYAPIAIPKKGHTLTRENRVAPTCERAGTKAHWICEDCEKLFKDTEDGTEEVTAAELVIPKRAHALIRVKGVAATCEKKGTRAYWTCEDCGRLFSDEEGTEEIDDPIVIPKKGHSPTHIEAKEATYDRAGNSEYWVCEECGKFFSDAACTDEIEENSWVIPQLPPEKITPEVKLSASTYTYTGKVKKPGVTVSDGKGNDIGAANYTVAYTNNVKAGKKAAVKVTLKGNRYSGTKTVYFTINKAANTLKVSGKKYTVKYKNVKKKAQILGVTKVIKFTNKGQGAKTYVKKSGNKKITINKKTGKVTVKKKLKKGTYKVKVKVTAAGSANYKKSAVKIVTLTIIIK